MSHKSSGHGKAPYHFKASGQTTRKYNKCSRVAFKKQWRQQRWVKEQQEECTSMKERNGCKVQV